MLSRIVVAAAFALLPALVSAQQTSTGQPARNVETLPDRQALTQHLRTLGYKVRGGVDRAMTDRDEARGRSFPHFSSSFSVNGATFPFTMVGHPPRSGRSAVIRSVIVPLRVNFSGFGPAADVQHSFDPAPAVANIIHSPLYKPAAFPDGTGQFGDQMQRAAFWNQMDREHRWHVLMDKPEVLEPVDIEVTPGIGGTLTQDASGNFFGDVPFDFMDSQIKTILQFIGPGADVLPVFVTDGVTNGALGYHDAFALDSTGDRLQTFVFTSWLDPALVDPLFADVSTFNHELLEWMNDPFVNNVVPDWFYPPPTDPKTVCSGNTFLEVGDPQGNGPTFADFPTVESKIGGVTYHLQQLVLWQWFADQVPSSALNGWYTFPATDSLKVPAVYCP